MKVRSKVLLTVSPFNERACSCRSLQEVNFCSCSITAACFIWICLSNYRTGQTSLETVECFVGKAVWKFFPMSAHWQTVSGMRNTNPSMNCSTGTKTRKSVNLSPVSVVVHPHPKKKNFPIIYAITLAHTNRCSKHKQTLRIFFFYYHQRMLCLVCMYLIIWSLDKIFIYPPVLVWAGLATKTNRHR